MSTVWKYELAITDDQRVTMPAGAELLHVADQYGRLALWARVHPGRQEAERLIIIRGTGQQVWPDPHVGTVVAANGSLVWHVFDGGYV